MNDDLYLSSTDTSASSSKTDLQDEPGQEQTTPDMTGIRIYGIFNPTTDKQWSTIHLYNTNSITIHKQLPTFTFISNNEITWLLFSVFFYFSCIYNHIVILIKVIVWPKPVDPIINLDNPDCCWLCILSYLSFDLIYYITLKTPAKISAYWLT